METEYKELEHVELCLLKDEKEGLLVELHSTQLDIKELTELSASAFQFLKNQRDNHKGDSTYTG